MKYRVYSADEIRHLAGNPEDWFWRHVNERSIAMNFKNRIQEPSTYMGLVGALGTLGYVFGIKELATLSTPEIGGAIAAFGLSIASIFKADPGSPDAKAKTAQ